MKVVEKLFDRAPLYLLAAFVLIALAGLVRREAQLRARVVALESKPCLMLGAHTGCERIGAR